MKLGPLDFKQPSTWRGLLGFAGLIGWTLSPELRDQIALALAAALSAIELLRDEYRGRAITASGAHATPSPQHPAAAAPALAEPEPDRLRLPSHPASSPPPGFGDR